MAIKKPANPNIYSASPLFNEMWEGSDASSNKLDISWMQKIGDLPIRGEKRLVPVNTTLSSPRNSVIQGNAVGSESEEGVPGFEAIVNAKKTLTDYVLVRIPNRSTRFFKDPFYTFRFLINPKSVSISRQTMDATSMARGGYMFGIWGEDTLDIHLNGQTAGQYFESGLTDRWEMYSQSYRNLMELVNVFENNGYHFEGESASKNLVYAAPDYTRKRIKCHGDVQLMVGSFLWSGMFTEMTVTHTADTPYFNTFDLGFLAWKERYVNDSPWLNSIENNVVRGHDIMVVKKPVETNVEFGPAMTEAQMNAIPSTPTDQANSLLMNANLAAGNGPVDPLSANFPMPQTATLSPVGAGAVALPAAPQVAVPATPASLTSNPFLAPSTTVPGVGLNPFGRP